MQGQKKIFTIILNAAIFIILEIAALSMLRNNAVLQDTWISKGFHSFYAAIWGKTESIKYYFSLKKTNDALAAENFLLSEQLRYYKELVNSQDTGKINFGKDNGGFTYTPATIAKISNNKQHNYLILDKGYDDGIRQQAGIITSNGVIGIIDAVSKNYSYALSFKNSGLTVSARIGREGPVGILQWDGTSNKGALLNEIPHHIDFHPGDTVYTSGFSSVFPRDIPIGTTQTARLVNGATYEIKVSLFTDFKALKYVTIVQNEGKDEIRELVSGQK